MKTLMEHLDELDELVRAAQLGRVRPQKFVDEFCAVMGKVSELINSGSKTGWQDADEILTSLVKKYEQNPDLQGVSDIGKELDRYRTESTQSP
jgi:hypothetical protein